MNHDKLIGETGVIFSDFVLWETNDLECQDQWRTVGQRIGGGGGAPSSGVMSQNILGGQFFRGSEATERGGRVWEGGTLWSFFIFST